MTALMPAPASRRIAAFAADYVVLAAYIAVLTASSFLFGIGQFDRVAGKEADGVRRLTGLHGTHTRLPASHRALP